MSIRADIASMLPINVMHNNYTEIVSMALEYRDWGYKLGMWGSAMDMPIMTGRERNQQLYPTPLNNFF